MNPQINRTDELIGRKEELIPELKPYLHNNKTLGKVLQSPLVFSVPHHSALNAFCNEQYRQKKLRLEESRIEKDWHRFVFWHERPFRLPAFTEICNELSPKEYWQLLADIWIDTESAWQYKPIWEMLLFRKEKKYIRTRHFFMNSQDKKLFKDLPQGFKIYRGCNCLNVNGFSWTLNKERAQWFATRFNHKEAILLEACVKKDRILAYVTGRNEDEIIVHPNARRNLKTFIIKKEA
jgi:hypothetical protein